MATFRAMLVFNQATLEPAPGAVGHLYVDGDETTLIPIFDMQGNPLLELVANTLGYAPPFRTHAAGQPPTSGPLVGVVSFGQGLAEAVLSVEAAGAIAQQALAVAQDALVTAQGAASSATTASRDYVDDKVADVSDSVDLVRQSVAVNAAAALVDGAGTGRNVFVTRVSQSRPTLATNPNLRNGDFGVRIP